LNYLVLIIKSLSRLLAMVFTCRACNNIFPTSKGLNIHISNRHQSNLDEFDHEVDLEKERKRVRLEDPVEEMVLEQYDEESVNDRSGGSGE